MWRLRDTGGNALVESAIVLPLWILLFLCILQLALLGRARLLAEYAAFRAARAGIVWGGDPERMQRAAIHTLQSTACPSRLEAAREGCARAAEGGGAAALEALSADAHLGFPGAHVHILSPHWPSHAPLFDLGGEELDFDRVDIEPARLDATLLSIRLHYFFELKIPFADAILWKAWMAIADPSAAEEEIHRGPSPRLSHRAFEAMRRTGEEGRAYFVPLVGHATLRMQSNFHARFVRDCSCLEGRGCSAHCRAW